MTIDDNFTPTWQPFPARRLMVDEMRKFRAFLGLTQAGLAGALGVSSSAVEEWEGGRNPPPPYLGLALERLAHLKGSADAAARRQVEDGRTEPTDDEAAGVA